MSVKHNKAGGVALRKESVDRNLILFDDLSGVTTSLSARRVWIEIISRMLCTNTAGCRSPQGECG